VGSSAATLLVLFKFFSIEPDELVAWLAWRRFGDDFESFNLRFKEWLACLKSKKITLLTNGILVVRPGENEAAGFHTVNTRLPIQPQPDFIARQISRLAESQRIKS